jgi:hypothetical protein
MAADTLDLRIPFPIVAEPAVNQHHRNTAAFLEVVKLHSVDPNIP